MEIISTYLITDDQGNSQILYELEDGSFRIKNVGRLTVISKAEAIEIAMNEKQKEIYKDNSGGITKN